MLSLIKNGNKPDKLIENLLINAKNTLPNEIIRFYCKNNYIAFKYEEILNEISPIYETLRRADRKRYGKNIKKGIIATLNSIDLFTFDKEKNLYVLNKNTALEILQRTQKENKKTKKNNIIYKQEQIYEFNQSDTEKNENNEDINKEKNLNNDKDNFNQKNNIINNNNNNIENESKNDDLLGKKRNIIEKTLIKNYPVKYFYAYDLLDDLLDKYINILNGKKNLINPFLKVKNIADLIAKIKDKDKIEGILICFKFFKPILRKFFLYKKKPRQINKELNSFNKDIEFVTNYLNLEKEE